MTNIQLIGDALRLIGVVSEVESPSAEQGSHALRQMNQMIEAWSESDIEFGYFAQTSPTDTAPVPAWAEEAVIASLAVKLAPTYGATVSPELAAQVNIAYGALSRKCINDKLTGLNMDHMPIGTGHYGTGWNITG